MGLLKPGAAAGLLGVLLGAALLSCQREWDSPYLPDSGDYVGAEWARDRDGDGVADSVEKYAPGCDRGPEECLKLAQAKAGVDTNKAGLDRVETEDMVLAAGGEAELPRFTVYPRNLVGVSYTLSSDNPRVAAIEDDRVKPLSEGSAKVTLTVTASDGPAKASTFKVTVVSKHVPVDKIEAEDMQLAVGETRDAEIKIKPEDATDRAFSLESEDPAIASVSGGAVTGKLKGSTRVHVRLLDGSGRGESFKVKVISRILDLDADDLEIDLGSAPLPPRMEFTPPEAATDAYVLTGGDPGVAVPSGDGKLIVPVGPGIAFFTVSAEGDIRDFFTATVVAPVVRVQGVRVEDMYFSKVRLSQKQSAEPHITWDPPDATDQGYTLWSDNPLIAFISGRGVEAGLPGETKVTLVTHEGGKRAEFKVRVDLLETGGGPGNSGKGKGGKDEDDDA